MRECAVTTSLFLSSNILTVAPERSHRGGATTYRVPRKRGAAPETRILGVFHSVLSEILYLSTMLYYTRQGFYYTHVRAVQSAATHFTSALQTPVIYGFIIWILLPWWGAPWTGTQPTAGPVWYTLLWPICLGKKAFLSKVYRKCQEVQLSLGVSSFFDTPDRHTV